MKNTFDALLAEACAADRAAELAAFDRLAPDTAAADVPPFAPAHRPRRRFAALLVAAAVCALLTTAVCALWPTLRWRRLESGDLALTVENRPENATFTPMAFDGSNLPDGWSVEWLARDEELGFYEAEITYPGHTVDEHGNPQTEPCTFVLAQYAYATDEADFYAPDGSVYLPGEISAEVEDDATLFGSASELDAKAILSNAIFYWPGTGCFYRCYRTTPPGGYSDAEQIALILQNLS